MSRIQNEMKLILEQKKNLKRCWKMHLGELVMSLIKYKIADFIQQRREKYDGTKDLPVRGVSREGFILPKQNNVDLSIYNIFYQGDFVFNPARMELNSIALNLEFEKGICSSLYEIFISHSLILFYQNIYIYLLNVKSLQESVDLKR